MRVLLPIDRNADRASAAARDVAALSNAIDPIEVTILNVQREIDIRDDAIIRSEDWYDEDEFPKSVRTAEEILTNAGIDVEKMRRHADPAVEILDTAEAIGADRIVMSGRKRSSVGKVLFGSVTQSVLLHSEIPVIFVPVPESES
jgi:nucleotide-binding universal stress UspA family protein